MLAGEIRKGATFEFEGNVYRVVDFMHVKPGKGSAFVRTTLNKIIDGNATEKQFICERVLNHSLQLQGVNTKILNTYLQYDFFKERKSALNKLADYISKITAERQNALPTLKLLCEQCRNNCN